MKKLISVMLCGIMLITGLPAAAAANEITHEDGNTYTERDIATLQEKIEEQDFYKDAAHNMAQYARKLGYPETHMIITLAQSRWKDANDIQVSYQAVIDQLQAYWKEKEAEYPVATYIWRYLKNAGYNDYVVAGLMGNMMRESGGHTLNIQPYITSSSGNYYGICQWYKTFGIHGASLDGQLELLVNTLPETMDNWGRLYYRGFNYEAFCNLQDVAAAATAFSKCYERGASFTHSYGVRNAYKAYSYFVG